MGELHCLLIVCAKLRSIELDVLRKKMVLCSDVHLARSLSHAWFMQLNVLQYMQVLQSSRG